MTAEAVPCAVCGAAAQQPLFHPARSPGPVVRCGRCGMVYVSPRLDTHALIFKGADVAADAGVSLDEVQGSWEWPILRTKEAERQALDRNSNIALDRLERWVRPPGRLLDFGCGGGFFLGAAQARGWETIGLEPLPGHAVYARATFNVPVVMDTLRDDTFAPESFDAITAFQVFEHLPQPREDLAQLAHSLRPGGALLIEVPNIDTWTVRLLGARHRHFVQDHLNFFSARTLGRLMAGAGLDVAEHYFPARYLSVRHLTRHWLGRLGGWLPRLAERMGLNDRLVRVNLGDIVAVVGRKPAG
jgi:SAM-dependent methyltransferase